jgi:Zn-dependent protease with chaperone function
MPARLAAALLALALLAAPAAFAASGPSGPPSELSASAAAAPSPAGGRSPGSGPAARSPGRGPGGPVAVPEPDAKALAYYRSGNLLWWLGQAFGVGFPLLLLATGFSARMRDRAERVGRHWIPTVAVYAVCYRALEWLAARPLAFYGGFLRPHAYGLSNQTFAKWLRDGSIDLAVSTGVGVLLAVGLYAWIRKAPRRWWLGAAACLVPFLLLVFLVEPLWIAPLYNDFGPMKNEALEAEILALAGRAGIEGSRVFEVAKSVDTNAVNAYVTGFLASKRIVLWDTLLARFDEAEVLAVMGHEMGHYVLHHVLQGIAVYSLLAGLGLYAIQRLAPLAIARWRSSFGFARLGDVASLPLLLLLLQLGSFAILPAALAFSRHMEHEADRFALELTQDGRAAALAFAKLQRSNLSHPRPGPLYVWWRATHPPLGERIDFANAYRPWERGEPLRYGDRFRAAP